MAARAIGAWVLCGLYLLMGSAMAQDLRGWADIADPEQLRWLFSNKTHTGVLPGGARFVGHYRADGRGIVIVGAQRLPRVWAVDGGRVCVTTATEKNCYTYKRNPDRANEFAATFVGRDYTVVVVVAEGIPDF